MFFFVLDTCFNGLQLNIGPYVNIPRGYPLSATVQSLGTATRAHQVNEGMIRSIIQIPL